MQNFFFQERNKIYIPAFLKQFLLNFNEIANKRFLKEIKNI